MHDTSAIPADNTLTAHSRSSHMTELINKCPHTADGRFIVRGKAYRYIRELAEDLEAGYDALCKRLRNSNHSTVEEAIAKPFNKKTTNIILKKFYNDTACGLKGGYIVYGKHYPNIHSIEKEYDIPYNFLREQAKKNPDFTLEELVQAAVQAKIVFSKLTSHVKKYADNPDAEKPVYTVHGRQFYSIVEVARAYKRTYSGLLCRLQAGSYPSLEAALESDIASYNDRLENYQTTDENGMTVYIVHDVRFASIAALCKHFQFNYATFTSFLHKNKFTSMEKAVDAMLRKQIEKNTSNYSVHEENYDTLAEIAEIYRISYSNLRLKSRKEIQDSVKPVVLDIIVDSLKTQDTIWHLYADDPSAELSTYTINGITFRSLHAAARYYNKNAVEIFARLLNGATLEEAVSDNYTEPFLIDGQTYDQLSTLVELCGVTKSALYNRIASGLYSTLEDAVLNRNKLQACAVVTVIDRLPVFVQDYINERSSNINNRKQYAGHLLRFLEFLINNYSSFKHHTTDLFTAEQLHALSPEDIKIYKDYLKNHAKDITCERTIYNHILTIRSFFRYLWEDGRSGQNET